MSTVRYLLIGFSIIGWTNFFDFGKVVADESTDIGNSEPDATTPLNINIYTAVLEDWEVGIVDNSVSIIPQPDTKNFLQGGVFGSDKFSFDLIQFSWKIIGKKIKLKALVTFHNSKYGSLSNAIYYPDGVIQIRVPIYANGNTDNSKFDEFGKIIQQIIPLGSQNFTSIRSGPTFSWYKTFPRSATYKYLPSSYYYAETGQLYNCSTTYLFPMSKSGNFLSRGQFGETFGLFNSGSGKQVNNKPNAGEPLAKAKEGKRIAIMPMAMAGNAID